MPPSSALEPLGGLNLTPGNNGLMNSGSGNSGILNGGFNNTGIANHLLGGSADNGVECLR